MPLDVKAGLERQEFSAVGSRPLRPDGIDKVTGRARFGADMTAPGMLIGLVLGVGSGIGLASLRELGDDSVRNPDQLESVTKFPVLAGIPPIITRKDISKRRWKRVALATGTIGVIVAGIVVFHFMVMDLNVFWAKLMRRLPI